MIEERIEIRDGKTYKAFYDEDGKQAAPAELVVDLPTSIPVNLIADVVDNLDATEIQAFFDWVEANPRVSYMLQLTGLNTVRIEKLSTLLEATGGTLDPNVLAKITAYLAGVQAQLAA